MLYTVCITHQYTSSKRLSYATICREGERPNKKENGSRTHIQHTVKVAHSTLTNRHLAYTIYTIYTHTHIIHTNNAYAHIRPLIRCYFVMENIFLDHTIQTKIHAHVVIHVANTAQRTHPTRQRARRFIFVVGGIFEQINSIESVTNIKTK